MFWEEKETKHFRLGFFLKKQGDIMGIFWQIQNELMTEKDSNVSFQLKSKNVERKTGWGRINKNVVIRLKLDK